MIINKIKKYSKSILIAVALVTTCQPLIPLQAQSKLPPNENLFFNKQDLQAPVTQLIIKYKDASKYRVATPIQFAREADWNTTPLMHQLLDSAVMELSQIAGVKLSHLREMSGDAHVLKFANSLPFKEAEILAKKIATHPDIALAEIDVIEKLYSQPEIVPNDTEFSQQWHLKKPTSTEFGINVVKAWDTTTGNANILIAVVDSGILADHPDLKGHILPGYDFISDTRLSNDGDGRDANASDPGTWGTVLECLGNPNYPDYFLKSSWHGTHVAGSIGAASNNNQGVAGINTISKVQAVRVLGKCGVGFRSDIIDGMRWAGGLAIPGVPANNTPARVINLSLGGYSTICPDFYQSAVDELVAKNVAIVVASGNSTTEAKYQSPANCRGVISVGGSIFNGSLSTFSSWGDKSQITVSAPGGDENRGILSTSNDGKKGPGEYIYESMVGTSMAAPQVAGIVSLMLSVKPALTPARVAQLLQQTVSPFPSNESCGTLVGGPGIANAANAVNNAKNDSTKVFLPAQFYDFVIAEPQPVETPPTLARMTFAKKSLATTTILNGSFECRGALWKNYSKKSNYDMWIPLTGQNNSLKAQHGIMAAGLGGYNDEIQAIGQDVTISADNPNLVFYYIVGSAEGNNCNNDVATVRVNGSNVLFSLPLCGSTQSNTWTRKSISLAAYVGQTIDLEFRVTTNASQASALLIDNITLTAGP